MFIKTSSTSKKDSNLLTHACVQIKYKKTIPSVNPPDAGEIHPHAPPHPGLLLDNNNGMGWLWYREPRKPPVDKFIKADWRELPTSSLSPGNAGLSLFSTDSEGPTNSSSPNNAIMGFLNTGSQVQVRISRSLYPPKYLNYKVADPPRPLDEEWADINGIRLAYGEYSRNKGAVTFVNPGCPPVPADLRPPNQTTPPNVECSGVVYVSLSFNNGWQWTTPTDTGTVTYEDRFWRAKKQAPGSVSPEPKQLLLRLNADALALSDQILPTNIIAHIRVEKTLIFDLSTATGVARDRFLIRSIHVPSGVVQIYCIPSVLPADPRCDDIMHLLTSLAHDMYSKLHDGLVTWALDPEFPDGKTTFKDGIPMVVSTGLCSLAEFTNRDDCLRDGSCSCSISASRDDGFGGKDSETSLNGGHHQYSRLTPEQEKVKTLQKRCEEEQDAGGFNCRWISLHTWTPMATNLVPLVWSHCSDPTKLTKEECLAGGKCPDKSLTSREACEAQGVCSGSLHIAPTKDMCEGASDDSGASGAGVCRPISSATGRAAPDIRAENRAASSNSYGFCGQFDNKVTCETPAARDDLGELRFQGPLSEEQKQAHMKRGSCGTCGPSSNQPDGEILQS